jgi:ribosomal protein S18 acetylase RimI-like enzyme
MAQPSMSVEITEVRKEHIDGCNAALDVVARERKYLGFLEAPPIEASRVFIGMSIAQRHPHFVALEGNRVVGIGILPQWRERGVGRRLMERTLEAARTFPLARVELAVRADNARAITLYGKLGFEVEGRRQRAMLVDGVYYDDIIMALLFDVAP